ncbi:hypothetical protein [Burkholderia aenigmatica]|uniref:hypothetical protein n=1 Tax=Burkholderia aenigmatica TaxID=2015348 RepID=UPI002655A1B7|nr:hypothetical protein [Burkholderia aenigmatica]MDN7876545.1 hypothetical protein [Burkholderia aenigmatica]
MDRDLDADVRHNERLATMLDRLGYGARYTLSMIGVLSTSVIWICNCASMARLSE